MKRIIRTSAFKNGFFNKDRFLISLFFLFGIGLLIGSVSAGSYSNEPDSVLNRIWNSYMENRATQSVFLSFLSTFSSCFIMLFYSYILGVCALGIPFLYIIPVFDGIGKGIILGFIYTNQGLIGFLKSLLFVLPQNILLCLILIFSINHSYRMSRQMYFNIRAIQFDEPFISFKKYNQKYIFFLICSIICAFFDALLFEFSKLLN